MDTTAYMTFNRFKKQPRSLRDGANLETMTQLPVATSVHRHDHLLRFHVVRRCSN